MEATLSQTSRPSSFVALPSRKSRNAGIALTALPALFLLFDAAMKLVKPAFVVQATEQLGYHGATIRPLGLVLLACTLLYVFPRTAVLGAVLLTGYLGGAIASHVRVGDPLFSHVLFPVYVALMAWGGLYLRDARVRALSPWNRSR